MPAARRSAMPGPMLTQVELTWLEGGNRTIPCARKLRYFRATGWWRTQSGETGLRATALAWGIGKSIPLMADNAFFGVQNGGGCAFPSA